MTMSESRLDSDGGIQSISLNCQSFMYLGKLATWAGSICICWRHDGRFGSGQDHDEAHNEGCHFLMFSVLNAHNESHFSNFLILKPTLFWFTFKRIYLKSI